MRFRGMIFDLQFSLSRTKILSEVPEIDELQEKAFLRILFKKVYQNNCIVQ